MTESPKSSRRFQRRVEDFTCERCGAFNVGDGYTNHCSTCLTSKHVDDHPGDRTAECGGLMRPVSVDRNHNRWRIRHRCDRCAFERVNTARPEETDAVIRLMRELSNLTATAPGTARSRSRPDRGTTRS